MGTYGTGILEDDVAMDVLGTFEDEYEATGDVGRAIASVREEHAEELDDSDDAAVVELALAQALLTLGVASHPQYETARRIIREGIGLERWEEAGAESIAARKRALAEFAAKLPA